VTSSNSLQDGTDNFKDSENGFGDGERSDNSPVAQLHGGLKLQNGGDFDNFKVLARGLDGLRLTFSCDLPAKVTANLREYKSEANEIGEPYETDELFNGKNLYVHSYGRNGYEYILANEQVEFRIARESGIGFPEIMVVCRSRFLWSCDSLGEIKKEILRRVKHLSGDTHEAGKLSRIDLCVDLEHLDLPSLKPLDHARTRIKHMNSWRDGRTITGYAVGKNPFRLNMYRKDHEIQQENRKEWFHEIWAQQNWSGAGVWRIEYQISRDRLKKFNLNTFDDIEQKASELWTRCTKAYEIVKQRTEPISRAELTDEWSEIQDLSELFGGSKSIYETEPGQAKKEELLKQIRGCMETYSALEMSENGEAKDIEEIAKELEEEVQEDFMKMVKKKAHKINAS
jgi:hypothetical protein